MFPMNISSPINFNKKLTVVRKKMTPCTKKTPVQKNEPKRKKNLFVKKFIFFVDKLNMINFNIFNMLKLIFTYESIAYLLQNSFVNVSFNSILFFLISYFDWLFEDYSVAYLLYFVLSLLDTHFLLSSLR